MTSYISFKEPPADFSPRIEAAGCCCLFQNKLLILKRAISKPQGGTWGVPGGKLSPGETRYEAVVREIEEEVGLDIQDDRLIELGSIYVRLPDCDYIFHLFYKEFHELPEVRLALDEHSEFRWLTLPECFELNLVSGGKEVLDLFCESSVNEV